MFSVVFFSSTESLRSYEFRNAMDLALLSAGADLSKGIQVYCTASVTRLVLSAIYSIVWLTVFLAPDQIGTITDVTSNIKELSKGIGALQKKIPLIYTVKAEVDAYSIFNKNYKYDDGKVVIFLPNSVFNDIIDGRNNFLYSLKSADSLKEGFFGLGIRKYTLLGQLKNKLFKNNQDSDSYLETHDVFINSCKIKKREKSAIGLSAAEKIDEFCSCWEGGPDEELSEEEQDKIKGEVEGTLDEILKAINKLKKEIKDVLENPVGNASNFFPPGYPHIGSYQVSNAIEYLNLKENKTKEDEENIGTLCQYQGDFELYEGNFSNNNFHLYQYLNSASSNITYINSTYKKSAKNGQFVDEGEAKKFESDVKSLKEYLNKPLLTTIGFQISTIDSIQGEISDTKNILKSYNLPTIKGVLDGYSGKLEEYEGKIKSLQDSIKYFQGAVRTSGKNFTKKIKHSAEKTFKKTVECSTEGFEALNSIKGLRVISDIATLNAPDLISHPGMILKFQDEVLALIKGDFAFISYYSPELSMPETLINKVKNLPTSSDELIKPISENIANAINSLVGGSAEELLDSIVKGPIENIKEIGNNIGNQIVKAIALSAAGTLIKGALSFGAGALLGIIQGVITTAVQSFIPKIVTGFIVNEIEKGVINPLIGEITKKVFKDIIPKQLFDPVFKVFRNIKLLIPRLIGQLCPPDCLTFNRYYLQKMIRWEAEAT